MTRDIKRELAQLRDMSPAQLREKYLQVFGEPSRSGNKDFLCKRIAWRLQSLAEGTLSERARQRAAELACDADIRVTMPRPPKAAPGAGTNAQPLAAARDAKVPMPGAVLTRVYRGQTIEVTVLPKGFEWRGEVHVDLLELRIRANDLVCSRRNASTGLGDGVRVAVDAGCDSWQLKCLPNYEVG